MFNLITLLIGSVMIGFATNSWLIGIGLFIIGFGFQIHINEALVNVGNGIVMQIVNRIDNSMNSKPGQK